MKEAEEEERKGKQRAFGFEISPKINLLCITVGWRRYVTREIRYSVVCRPRIARDREPDVAKGRRREEMLKEEKNPRDEEKEKQRERETRTKASARLWHNRAKTNFVSILLFRWPIFPVCHEWLQPRFREGNVFLITKKPVLIKVRTTAIETGPTWNSLRFVFCVQRAVC